MFFLQCIGYSVPGYQITYSGKFSWDPNFILCYLQLIGVFNFRSVHFTQGNMHIITYIWCVKFHSDRLRAKRTKFGPHENFPLYSTATLRHVQFIRWTKSLKSICLPTLQSDGTVVYTTGALPVVPKPNPFCTVDLTSCGVFGQNMHAASANIHTHSTFKPFRHGSALCAARLKNL